MRTRLWHWAADIWEGESVHGPEWRLSNQWTGFSDLLVQLLLRTCGMQCYLTQDRIYALWGMVRKVFKEDIPPELLPGYPSPWQIVFHNYAYTPGFKPHQAVNNSISIPPTVDAKLDMETKRTDVLICGSGSAGLCAAAWLSRYGVDFKILEQAPGPLKVGKADGVQTRTVEIFDSFGIGSELVQESCHVMEVAFWGPDSSGGSGSGPAGIKRLRFAPDKEDGISHRPHVILNQARLHDLLLSRLNGSEQPQYDTQVKEVLLEDRSTASATSDYPVRVRALHGGEEQTWEAKYVLACDGAHSTIRRSLGFQMVGDTTESAWGVMDIFCRTDFPDIRKKTVLSSTHGSLVIIPREGDFMVRFYLELPSVTSAREVTLENLQQTARQLFHPYTVDFLETVWWSAYVIGQRMADFFHKDHRVFLTGDACHTHSPKAGQGMNVSLQDGYNIGWKLGQILRDGAHPALLETYVSERRQTAQDLIDFDINFTKLFSIKHREANGITAEQVAAQFVQAGRYTAGQGTHYAPSLIVSEPTPEEQALATELVPGTRMPSAQVVRFSDAKTFQLLDALESTCHWRIIVFSGNCTDPQSKSRLDHVSKHLESLCSRYRIPGSDSESLIQPLLVLKMVRTDLHDGLVPLVFTPTATKWKIKSLHNVYVDDCAHHVGHGRAFESYGIHSDRPELIVVIRPDQYIANVCSFDRVDSVSQFFEAFMKSSAA
ncbi:FAD binding domain-domain-containing protein [Microdochium bolleyi]|uniref:FAD binding domain-domain-containing protein n=1 Tax=Microdochium bolleyi TaxID=196109 RepID=A0A136IT13_9PEZI|nr:FAD binding domain-domain-containing protein [Microdochium bolleyi]